MKLTLNDLRGKYIRQALERLEFLGKLTPEVRKTVLDAMNDYSRAVEEKVTEDYCVCKT
jgi:hypothetical protein